MSEISKLAEGRWRSILLGLGVDSLVLTNKHQPCPICGGKDRYRFDDKNGRGDYYCGQCGAGDGFKLLMGIFGWDFKKTAQEVEKYLPDSEVNKPQEKKDPRPLLRKIAKGSHPGVEVAGYLKGRGLPPHTALNQCRLDYFENGLRISTYEAMIGLIVDKDNKPVSYHVTYLKDRKKAPVNHAKKVMPGVKSITGCAIRLGDGQSIGVTEGIETALAVHERLGLPVYAAINAGNLEKLEIPEHVQAVQIFADNDQNFTGQKAAYALANRLALKGLAVRVHVPQTVGSDFADEHLKEQA